MNDDFLRRAWRRPPAAFANQLRERLREQERTSQPPRRSKLGLLIVSVLIGGSALAAVTYLTAKHFSLLSSPASEVRPASAAPSSLTNPGRNPRAKFQSSQPTTVTTTKDLVDSSSTPPGDRDHWVSGAGAGDGDDGDRSSGGSSSADIPASESGSSTVTAGSLTAAPVRIAVSPELAALAKDISNTLSYRTQAGAEITGTDAAFRALCTQASASVDVVIASRHIHRSELDRCKEHGMSTMLEAKLGHMATVITRARSGSPMQLSADTIMRALLKRIPSPDGLIDNPYTDWQQVDPLEPGRIEVLGPPRDSQHFLLFAATILEPACDKYAWLRDLRATDRGAYEEICHAVREDGRYKDAPFDNTFVRQRLWADPNIVAIVDFPFYSANSEDLLGSLLEGPAPTSASIADGTYPAARTAYLYVSRARYGASPAVSSFLNNYLRVQDFARWMLPPEGGTEPRRSYRMLPLTEVKLE